MDLRVFKGTITRFELKRVMVPAGFFFAGAAEIRRDQNIQKGFAVLHALAGNSGGASSALTNSSAEMAVEQVEFTLGEKKFIGLLEAFPFAVGDEVEAVAEGDGTAGGYKTYAVARPADRLVAMQPMCTRGRDAYFARARRRSVGVVAVAVLAALAIFSMYHLDLDLEREIGWCLGVLAGTALVWGFIEWRAYLENYKPLVHLTERVMELLGVGNARGVDLVRKSKQTRTSNDPVGYRWKFYRY